MLADEITHTLLASEKEKETYHAVKVINRTLFRISHKKHLNIFLKYDYHCENFKKLPAAARQQKHNRSHEKVPLKVEKGELVQVKSGTERQKEKSR